MFWNWLLVLGTSIYRGRFEVFLALRRLFFVRYCEKAFLRRHNRGVLLSYACGLIANYLYLRCYLPQHLRRPWFCYFILPTVSRARLALRHFVNSLLPQTGVNLSFKEFLNSFCIHFVIIWNQRFLQTIKRVVNHRTERATLFLCLLLFFSKL